MRKWILCFLLMFSLSACSNVELQKQTFTFELGQDVYNNPANFVKEANDNMEVKAVSQGIRVKQNRFVTGTMDYLVCGTYDFEIISGSKTIPFKIKIKDTKAPTLSDAPSEITTPAGESIDWDSFFGAKDLSGVEYSTDPSIDTSSVQTSEVTLKIEDRYGNSVTKTVVVNVE